MSKTLLVLALLLIGSPAIGQVTTLTCDACRSVFDHPNDYGNFVFNETFGDSPSLTFGDADMVRVSNRSGHWAMVDLSFMMSSYGTAVTIVGISQQILLPTGLIQVRVQDPRGTMTQYRVFIHSEELLVGIDEPAPAPPEPPPPPPPPPAPAPAPAPSPGTTFIGHGGIGAAIYPGFSAAAFGPFVPMFMLISTPYSH